MNRIVISNSGTGEGYLLAAMPAPVFRRLSTALGNLYCRRAHKSISTPVAGKYRCWKCLREFEIDWK